MSTLAFPTRGDTYGNRQILPYLGESGDVKVKGILSVDGIATLNSDVYISGNLYFSSTSIVDVLSSSIYTANDSIIRVNLEFTTGYITESGMEVMRGADPSAKLVYTEDPTQTVKLWKAGVGTDLLPIGRVANVMTDQSAIRWDSVTNSLTSYTGLTLTDLAILMGRPLQATIPTGYIYSWIRYNQPLNPIFAVEHWMGGLPDDAFWFGVDDYTYDGQSFTNGCNFSTEKIMKLSVRTPSSNRVRYILDDVLSMGKDDSIAGETASLLHTDTDQLRLESPARLDLKVGTGGLGADGPKGQLIVSVDSAKFTVPINLSEGISAATVTTNKLTTKSMNYEIPSSVDPLPTPTGWTGDITYGNLFYNVSWANRSDYTSYEVIINFTVSASHPNLGSTTSIVVPIYLGLDLGNLRALSGVFYKISGGNEISADGIAASDLRVEPITFPLDGVYLTLPNLANYYYLRISNFVITEGVWKFIITIITKLPEVVF